MAVLSKMEQMRTRSASIRRRMGLLLRIKHAYTIYQQTTCYKYNTYYVLYNVRHRNDGYTINYYIYYINSKYVIRVDTVVQYCTRLR